MSADEDDMVSEESERRRWPSCGRTWRAAKEAAIPFGSCGQLARTVWSSSKISAAIAGDSLDLCTGDERTSLATCRAVGRATERRGLDRAAFWTYGRGPRLIRWREEQTRGTFGIIVRIEHFGRQGTRLRSSTVELDDSPTPSPAKIRKAGAVAAAQISGASTRLRSMAWRFGAIWPRGWSPRNEFAKNWGPPPD